MFKIIGEILGLLWRVIRQVLWLRIRRFLGRIVLFMMLATLVITALVFLIAR